MTRYSIQPRDRIFVKCYGFGSFAKNMGKNIGLNVSKNVSGKYSPGMSRHHAKQKKQLQKQLVIWLIKKLLIKLLGLQKIQKPLQKSTIKKDIYLQKKGKKLLTI